LPFMFQRLSRHVRAILPWQRTLYTVFVAQLFSAVGMSTIFPFLPLYVQELGTRTSLSIEFLAGAVFSAQAATMMLTSPLWGALADRFGRKLMIQRAMFGGAAIIFLMGYARTAEELVLLRAIQGLITGVVSAANALVASVAPRERLGFAMGMIQVALRAGVAVGPLIGGAIADALGYQQTFIVTAGMLIAGGLLVRYGVEESFSSGGRRRRGGAGLLSGWQHVLRASGVKPAYSLRFLAGLASVLIVPILPLFVQVLLPDASRINTLTGLMTGLASAATTATAVYLGRLGDRIGHRRVLRISALLAGLFYLPQGFATQAWHLLLLQALTGAAIGGIIPTVSALLASYTEPDAAGSVYGLDSSIFAASRALAPLLGSAVAVWFGFPAVFALAGLLYLALTMVAFWRLPEAPSAVRLETGV
jgi:DHA1 family multidrug resistance protein-like MFS transporter